ncbi:uncharacterized protein LOC129612178 [Condylostylus longicornis]|uniref:uncharacterized protein LOC129612178 n=1 Tax=Condylostylus longicornis TaxID=2530218 RepID=UPI00244E0481|nr:uncharacterized protein LOC129612178 [Condylostylus longicornis]
MDVHVVQLDLVPSKGKDFETILNKENADFKQEKDNIHEKDCNKILIDNCDFITMENTNEELLSKSELEISTSEFIIDEDNYNISPNTSSDPCVDPLAIDDYNAEEVSSNINDSQFSLSKDNIIYIVDVDDIKDNSVNSPKINSIKISSLEDIHCKVNRNIKEIEGGNLKLLNNQNLEKSSTNDENEMPSDGSDSGLGLDNNLLQIDTYHKMNNTITILEKNISNPISNKIPNKSSLKRRSDTLEHSVLLPTKRNKRSIQFDNVKIFYFPRIQGFCCVPSQGGCTLGMGAKHIQSKTYKLSDHVNEQSGDKVSMQLCGAKGSSSDETDSDEDLSEENISDLDPDSSGFLQPVPVKSRRALLKAAGIKKIDSSEKDECRAIRGSREYCGCLCRGFCDPDTCSCSQNGIKCQVDRPNFPCGCTRDGCGNAYGRIEFNPTRVRTHYIHTIMRLEIENKTRSTFMHEIQPSQRFFPNSGPVEALYEGENSTAGQNSIQFFPDPVSITDNDNNFDLFPLHNGEDNSRIFLSADREINSDGEFSYPVLKSFLIPTNNQQDELVCSSLLSKASQRNNLKILYPLQDEGNNSRISLPSADDNNIEEKLPCPILKACFNSNKCEKSDETNSTGQSKVNENAKNLLSLHNTEDNLRISLSEIENVDELLYPVSKSFLTSTDKIINSSKSSNPENNVIKISTSGFNITEPKYLGNCAQGYDSFSSAYANFLEEAYLPSKANFTEKIHNEISDVGNTNYNQNQIERSPVHDLLNINRNNTLPLYCASPTELVPKKDEKTKIEPSNSPTKELNSTAKICTLAPTAHTSTSIFEGTSTTIVSNYVSSLCSHENKNNMSSTTDCTASATNSNLKCDLSETNCTETKMKKENTNECIPEKTDIEILISELDCKPEHLSQLSPPQLKTITYISPLETTCVNTSNTEDTKNEMKLLATV